jgi:glycosyltransferase involved in cell wall biosynthesis
VFVITSLDRGGSEGQLAQLLARIHPEPVAATLVTLVPTRDGLNAGRLQECGVPRVVLTRESQSRARRGAQAAIGLDRLLRNLRPDVVYAWGEYASLVAVPVARMRGIPIVVARRNSDGDASIARWLQRAARRADARAQLVTVNSLAAFEAAARHGVARHRLRLVPNGHDGLSPSTAPPADEVRAGYVARLLPGKGHRQLLDALVQVRARHAWGVDLAGTGRLLDELRAEVDARGLAGRVRFLGMVDDIRGFWRQHEACVLLSESEGSSNALIEAGLAGRPLVATDVAGNRELVTPDSGILVRAGDAQGTARAIEAIIDDRRLRERLGRGAAHAMRRFDIDGMVRGHFAVLAECRRAAGRR